nr:diacylglyceryl transferase [Acidobacteriota bacterium]
MTEVPQSPFGAPLHGLFVLLGTVAAVVVFLLGARRRGGLGDDLMTVLLGALICGTLGAKLAVVWRYLDSAPAP